MEYKERAREAEAASMTTAAPAMEVVEAPSGRKSNQKNRHAAAVRIAQHESGVRLAIAGPRACFLGWRTTIFWACLLDELAIQVQHATKFTLYPTAAWAYSNG